MSKTSRELLQDIEAARHALVRMDMCDTKDHVEGVTRKLFEKVLKLRLNDRSKSITAEALTEEGLTYYKIKGRVEPNFFRGGAKLSDFRNFVGPDRFDYLLVAIYDEDFNVLAAGSIPYDIVVSHMVGRSNKGKDVDAAYFVLTEEIMEHKRVKKLRNELNRLLDY